MLFEYNANTGLAAASTQKIITSTAAFELLGKDYRYQTKFFHDGKIEKNVLKGSMYLMGSCDPTFGSWRYTATKPEVILKNITAAFKKKGIRATQGYYITVDSAFSSKAIPDGWIWQDIGNYYGAGAYQLNWRENQFDVKLRSGDNIGDPVEVAVETAFLKAYKNELKAAAKGSGDNAYVYLPVGMDGQSLLQGTIPVGEKSFTISAATADPGNNFIAELYHNMRADSIEFRSYAEAESKTRDLIYTHQSPPLDSINYWFMRRSINLYGEALIKAIAYEKKGYGSTEGGIELVRNFFHERGIDKNSLRMIDGSGLSPQNRITAASLVSVLQFAKSRPWFASFYESLPMYNGMKLKSGSIGGARAFAGFHTATDGKQYVVAIIINNYSGSSSSIVQKMYKVLDALK